MTEPKDSILKLVASGRVSINPMTYVPYNANCYSLHLDTQLYAYKKDYALPWLPADKNKHPSLFDWYKNKDIFRDVFKRMANSYGFNSKINGNYPEKIEIPKTGLMLRPDVLYIGKTNERLGLSNVSALIGQSFSANILYGLHVKMDKIEVGFGWDYTLDCPTNGEDSKPNISFKVAYPVVIIPGMDICTLEILNEIPKQNDCDYNNKKCKTYRIDRQNTR